MRALCSRNLSVLFLCLFAGVASATDWPQWRGPLRDGVSTETGLLKSWPAGGPSLAWKASGLGVGYSGVAVAGGRIYTMGDLPEANYVVALDEKTGRKLWMQRVGKAGAPGGYAGPRCTPTVNGTVLYVEGQMGEIACLEAATGRTVWTKHLVKDFGGSQPSWGFAESPLVDVGAVFFTPGGAQGSIVALNRNTGQPIWRTKEFTDNPHYSSIVRTKIDGTFQYVQLTDEHVVGILPMNGKVLWEAPRKGKTAVITTPVCSENFVFVTSGYGVGCNLFNVSKQGDRFDAEQVYANNNMENHHGGVVLIGSHLYGHSDSKGWTCLDLKTGQVAWSEKGKLGKGSLCSADGMLYLRSESGPGTVVLAEASPTGFVEKGRFNQPERSSKNSWPHPVVANGKLYLRDQENLFCYDVKAR